MRLRSEKGMGLIIVSMGISAVLAMGAGAVLLLTRQVKQKSVEDIASFRSEERNRNALVYTAKLLSAGCLRQEENGAWRVEEPCRQDSDWRLEPGSNELTFHACSAAEAGPLPTGESPAEDVPCKGETTRVTLLETVSDGRRKARATSAVVGKYPRSLTALLQAPEGGCTPGIKYATLDFESFAEGQVLDDSTNANLEADYGVRFEYFGGGRMKVAKVTRQGDPEPVFKAWKSLVCGRNPRHNGLCNEVGPSRAGSRVLSTTDSLDTRQISFRVIYKQPVKALHFDLADVDGSEEWRIVPYDQQGRALTSGTRIALRGYGGRSGNSALVTYSVERDTADIAALKVTGTKNIRIFGFGFDNFTTGLSVCPGG